MDIREKASDDEFRKCDNCNNDRGVQSSLLKTDDKYKVILTYPEFDSRYDVGWSIDI